MNQIPTFSGFDSHACCFEEHTGISAVTQEHRVEHFNQIRRKYARENASECRFSSSSVIPIQYNMRVGFRPQPNVTFCSISMRVFQVTGIQCGQSVFLQTTVMFMVDICTKRGISRSRYTLISHLSQQEMEEKVVELSQRAQFKSHQWIFLKTLGDIFSSFSGGETGCLFK